MKVNIFGVGRSGTKALQLWIAYALIKKYGKAYINYEPYYFQSRLGGVNYKGFWTYLKNPFFISREKKLTRSHARFIKKLDAKGAVVTKFIRANGHISQIIELLPAYRHILVIRDLYDVLSSILMQRWDFYRIGTEGGFASSRIDFFEKLVKDAKNVGLVDKGHQKIIDRLMHKNDRITKNAFYWYWMNKFALLNAPNSLEVLAYKEMAYASIFEGLIDKESFNKICSLPGILIGENHFIRCANNNSKRKLYLSIINDLSYYTFARAFNFSPYIPLGRVGESNILNEDNAIDEEIKLEFIRPTIKNNTLLTELNKEIFDLLTKSKNSVQKVKSNS